MRRIEPVTPRGVESALWPRVTATRLRFARCATDPESPTFRVKKEPLWWARSLRIYHITGRHLVPLDGRRLKLPSRLRKVAEVESQAFDSIDFFRAHNRFQLTYSCWGVAVASLGKTQYY